MWAAREACSPALRKSFRGAMHATPDRDQIQVFRLSVFTLEASFLLSHCMTVRVVCATSHAVWLRLSFRSHFKFHAARLPLERSLLSLAPRLMTP